MPKGNCRKGILSGAPQSLDKLPDQLMFSARKISVPETARRLDRQSAAGTQHKFKAEIDMTRPVAREYQLRRGLADGVAVNADG